MSDTSLCHILNGDSLDHHFPKSIPGQRIIARECLIDGNVEGASFDELMSNRADFISSYPECTRERYIQSTVPEFKKIMSLGPNEQVICWFEDDLFCQANLWFVLYLLKHHSDVAKVFLVRPNKGNEYSFAHMSEQELIEAFNQKTAIEPAQLKALAELWPNFQQGNITKLIEIANRHITHFPFLLPAAEAHQSRQPDEQGLGYPERVLLDIMKQQTELAFAPVLREFCDKMAIFSFGDLQVKARYDKLKLML